MTIPIGPPVPAAATTPAAAEVVAATGRLRALMARLTASTEAARAARAEFEARAALEPTPIFDEVSAWFLARQEEERAQPS